MLSPNAEQIEEAADNLIQQHGPDYIQDYPNLSEFMLISQLKELDGFGPGRHDDLMKALAAIPPSADGISEEFRAGYLLGLQTARVVLMTSATLAAKAVKAEDIL